MFQTFDIPDLGPLLEQIGWFLEFLHRWIAFGIIP